MFYSTRAFANFQVAWGPKDKSQWAIFFSGEEFSKIKYF